MAIEINNNEINLYMMVAQSKTPYTLQRESTLNNNQKRYNIYNVWQKKINMDETNFYMLVAQSKTLCTLQWEKKWYKIQMLIKYSSISQCNFLNCLRHTIRMEGQIHYTNS